MTRLVLLLALICMLRVFPASKAQTEEQAKLQTYIVHVKKPDGIDSLQSQELHNWYQSFLPTSTESSFKHRMVFSYQNVVSGFAIRLTEEEAKSLQDKDEIVSARPERTLSLHTTHTPRFLGLRKGSGLWKDSDFGEGVIIGVIDTGIHPFHPSFSDEGMPVPPSKWKGYCEFNGQRTCNNKLIGARNLVKTAKQEPPFETNLHGTHTAGEAAGNFVAEASVFGNAQGTAAGMAPKAHVAMYKVCNVTVGCPESAILAAMDVAIEDGVDVLSLSLGGSRSVPFFDNAIALGAFTAVQKGIFVSCSAGNFGPDNATLSNEAPWILTAGASTIDRTIKATARLGNGLDYDGKRDFNI